MINYQVNFSFHENIIEENEIGKAKAFLDDLITKDMIVSYNIFKAKEQQKGTEETPYQATILMGNTSSQSPFEHIQEIGIKKGLHGTMIKNVKSFDVEIFDVL